MVCRQGRERTVAHGPIRLQIRLEHIVLAGYRNYGSGFFVAMSRKVIERHTRWSFGQGHDVQQQIGLFD